MADQDYYKILGIERDADEGTIKKAYRKLALKWHPDKNPDNKDVAESNFKIISEAYDVLSDSEKKVIYDKYGKAGLTSGGGGGGGGGGRNAHGFAFNFGGGHPGNAFHFRSADDIFQDFFEHDPFGEDILADFFGRRNGRDPRSSNVSRARDPFMHPFASFGMGMGGFGNGFSAFGNDAFSSGMSDGFSSSSSFSSGGGSFKSSSTSTKVVNGRKIVTKKIVENGQETVEVYENNVLTKRTVNGVPQIAGSDASSHNIQGSYR